MEHRPLKMLITGASGMIGSHLNLYFQKNKYFDVFTIPHQDLLRTEWTADIIIHCAGLAHAKRFRWDTLYESNIKLTAKLAKKGLDRGLRHFIYFSSIKAKSPPSQDLYGQSKLMAENKLHETLKNIVPYTILRPSLVYGSGVKANFNLLIKSALTNLPLPFASAKGKRSYLYIENLLHLVENVIFNEKAYNKTYELSDNDDKSVREIVTSIREMKAKQHGLIPSKIFPFPPFLAKQGLRLIGKKSLYEKIWQGFQVTDFSIYQDLGIKPLYTFQDGLEKTITDFKIKRP